MLTMRWDLGIAYFLTALFAMAVVILGAGVQPDVIAGNDMAVAFADQLVPYAGNVGRWLFLLGFWGAVYSSMLGVWQGVPYLFANFVAHYRKQQTVLADPVSITRSNAYRGYLAFMCFLPMIMVILGRPVWIVVVYAVTGAFFMPLLAALLLYMNSKLRWLGGEGNSWKMQLCLWLCLALFGYLLFAAPSA
jgi:Mn2+/Fe2+ NRAMP family transporter